MVLYVFIAAMVLLLIGVLVAVTKSLVPHKKPTVT